MDKKILIIGDDESTQTVLLQAFTRSGLRASAISSGRNAVLQLFLTQPDLIILDLRLSDPDRWEMLQQIRQLSTIPVIVLTMTDDYRVRVEGLDRGADYVMTKPFDLRELQARVSALFRRIQAPARSAGVSNRLQPGSCLPVDLALIASARQAPNSH